MAVPDFLNTAFAFVTVAAETDMANVITQLRTTLLALGWTEPSANLFKSPVDSAGKYFDLLFTRIAQGNLEMRVRDQNAITICTRRAQIDIAGTNYDLFAGTHHFVISFKRATRENMWAGMLDQSPIAQAASSVYTFGSAHRTAADVVDSNCDVGDAFMLDNGIATFKSRNQRINAAPSASVTNLLWGDGTQGCWPCTMLTQPGANSWWGGRVYQVYMVDGAQAFDSDLILPIDDGVTATFRVVGFATIDQQRMAVRKA